jgi:tRNA nucleotidyltransferase/poly(A) polymerase
MPGTLRRRSCRAQAAIRCAVEPSQRRWGDGPYVGCTGVTRDDPLGLQRQVLQWLADRGQAVYLVGGCIRDRLLGRPIYDIDVAVASRGLALARLLADRFGGDYYPLDEARGTGRAILRTDQGSRLVVDVSELRGAGLHADLADRDFTINALAEDLAAPGTIIDHFHGLADLQSGVIRPVGLFSIRDDPLRALRAVRLAAELGFLLAPQTEELIRLDGAAVAGMSGERIRDELSRILLRPRCVSSLEQLDRLGLLSILFPELDPLRGVEQPAPHSLDALAHSLATVRALEGLIDHWLLPSEAPFTAGVNPPGEQWLELLAPFALRLKEHLEETLGDTRPRLVTLKLATLLHDTGKPSARASDPEGRVRFFGHEVRSAAIVWDVMGRLRFTGSERRLGETIVAQHMRPLHLLSSGPSGAVTRDHPRPERDAVEHGVTSRAVYRFFRDTKGAGVDVLLHAMADHQATHARASGQETWTRLVELTARMLDEHWGRQAQAVRLPPFVDGHDLLQEFGLSPGPQIGELLEAVREAQACGEVSSRGGALSLVRTLLLQAGDPVPGA